MNKTKQLNQIIDEYTSNVVFGDILDSTTNEALAEHFHFRYACDDDEKFIFFFQRNMKELKRRYNDLLENESVEVDPLVVNLKARTISATNSGTLTDSIAKTLTGLDQWSKSESLSKSSTVSGTVEGTGSSTGSASYSDSHDNTRTDNLTQETSGQNIDRKLHSDMPQANTSPSSSIDYDDTISWTYVSDAQDSVGKNNNTVQDTGTVVDNYDASGSSQNTTTTSSETESTQTGTETHTKTNTDSLSKSDESEETRERTQSGSNSTAESESGRSNHLVSEILHEWENYIKETDAFLWLCKNLEKCFMSNLLYEEG